MKKIITILLLFAIILSTCIGCSEGNTPATAPATEATPKALKVGYGRVDITPEDPYPIAGGKYERTSTGADDPLLLTCVAITDGNDNTVLIFSADIVQSYNDFTPWAKKDVQKETGVPVSNIMICSTHTHRGPSISTTSTKDNVIAYTALLRKKFVEAARQAFDDRKDAQMLTTSTTLEGMNFIRHYVMDDGSIVGDNFGSSKGKKYASHVTTPDNEMQLIQFTRDGGEDIVMVNWQAHPHRTGVYSTTFSADIVGTMRDAFEKETGSHFIYFSGASGDVNSHSRITAENVTADYVEQGQVMAKAAVDALKNAKSTEYGNLQLKHQTHKAAPKEDRKSVLDFEMDAISLGNVGFVFAPYEMFSVNGRFIKDNSPFEMTFVITYANYHLYYVPSAYAFEYGAEYEIKVTRYAQGTAEDLADKYVAMLKDIYPTR